MCRFILTLSATLAFALLSACTIKNKHGNCIGVLDKENPNLDYEVEPINVVAGLVFWESFIVPAVVVAYDLRCPTGVKENGSSTK